MPPESISSLNDTVPVAPIAAAAVPLWQVDAGGRLIWCNDAYAALYGLGAGAVIVQQKILSSAKSGRQHLVVGGQRHLFAVTLTPLPDGAGQIGVAQDVTREEELSSEFQRAQTATKELLEQLRTAIATFTADQRLEFFNSAYAALWDLDEPFLLTKPKLGEILERLREMRRLPEQVDFRRYKQSWLDMFTNLIDPFEDMMHLPNDAALRVLVVPNPAGGLMLTFEDVTSRLALETSYNTLVAVQRETLDNLNEGIAVFGGDGRLKLWNPSFAQLWALNPEDMDGEPHVTRLVDRLKSAFDDDAWASARDNILAQVLNGAEVTGRLILADGRMLAYATVLLPDGGVLLSHTDVTDSVRVENALRDKNSALETAERLKLDFLANVSYQLRTPLNAIMGFTEILDHEYFGTLNEKQKQYTKGTREASERLLSLIDDILDLSTIEAGYLKLDYDRIDVADLLSGLQGLTGDWARKEGLDVTTQLVGDPGMIEADPRRLKQIILNLIRNAITYSPVGGKITIAAERVGDHIDLRVMDNGTGIMPEDQMRVLEPFERGQNADQRGKGQGGAGLGLTLVKNIAQLHGGSVHISSESGAGTTVTIRLPVTAPYSTSQMGNLPPAA